MVLTAGMMNQVTQPRWRDVSMGLVLKWMTLSSNVNNDEVLLMEDTGDVARVTVIRLLMKWLNNNRDIKRGLQ